MPDDTVTLDAAIALLRAIADSADAVECACCWPQGERAVVVPEALVLRAIELVKGDRP